MTHHQLSWKQEAFSIFISGGLPIFIAYGYGGIDLMEKITKGLVINDWLLYYSAICAFVAVAISYFDYKFDFNSSKLELFCNSISASLLDSFGNFISVFKVVSGLLCSIAILWVILDFKFEDTPRILYLAYVGGAAAICSFQLTKLHNHAKLTWLKLHLNKPIKWD